jgi:AcrR family transcriptional regulator
MSGALFTLFTMSDPRERILAEACDLYLADGLDGFSMRKLAKQVGVTAPALYRHYAGKEAVLADVLREAYRIFTRYVYRALEAPTPLERFTQAGEGYLDFVLEHPRWYSILFSGPEALGMQALPGDIEATGCAVHQFWIDRVRECMDAGILKRGDPASTSVTMWAHAHGMIQLYHQGQFRMDAASFRALFGASGARLMAGVATDEFARALAARHEETPVGAATGRD